MTIRSRVITVWPQESIRQTSLSINGKKEDEDELRLWMSLSWFLCVNGCFNRVKVEREASQRPRVRREDKAMGKKNPNKEMKEKMWQPPCEKKTINGLCLAVTRLSLFSSSFVSMSKEKMMKEEKGRERHFPGQLITLWKKIAVQGIERREIR